MKQKRIYMALALLLTVLAANAQNKVKAYFTTKEMPDMLKFAPAPPDSTSAPPSHHGMRLHFPEMALIPADTAS